MRMPKDSNSFRQRFQYYKQTGKLPYKAGRVNEELATDAIQRRQLPLEYQSATRRTIADINQERLAQVMAQNQASIGPNQNVSKQLQDYYRQKDETAKWAAQKKAIEEGTDEMMLGLIDPRYIAAGAAVGAVGRAVKGTVAASKLYKSYKLSRAINKAVKAGISGAKDVPEFVPGQVGWAPKTFVRGYHASNEEQLNPNFWFNGWAQQKGAPSGFYIAGGETPEGGFLAKRPYVHNIETEFEKPMVQIGDIPARPGFENVGRNAIERSARDMGADGIIYQDIADNQLKHQYIAKTLNPDVQINVNRTAAQPMRYDYAEEVGDFGGRVVRYNRQRGRGVRYNSNGTINVEPDPIINYNNQGLLPPQVGANALVDSEGNVNMHHLANVIKQFYKKYPQAGNFREIVNRGLGGQTNLWEHIRDVVRSAQAAPVPEGATRQEFVQAALLHDIGKTLDRSYSGHPEASLKILDEMGISVSPQVRRAIKVHMRGSDMNNINRDGIGSIGKESPLARALHFADVVRSQNPMTNAPGGAYYEYRNLLYPTVDQYKILDQYKWDTDYQLENIVNPILRAYGYKEIKLGLPAKEARRQLIQKIQTHRRFVRGQHGLGDPNDPGNQDNLRHAIQQFVAREGRQPTTDELYLQGFEYFKARNTQSGTRGAESYMHKMELPWKNYMSLYTSNSSDVPMSYRRTSQNPYAIAALEMPVQDNPEWSLAELWGYNDYPMVFSPYDPSSIRPSNFNTDWRIRILPFVLDHGTGGKMISFDHDMDRRNFISLKLPEIQKQVNKDYEKVASTLQPLMPSEIEPSDFVEGYIPNNPSGRFHANHFRPHIQPAIPFSAAPFVPSPLAPAPVSKPQVIGNYAPTDYSRNSEFFDNVYSGLNYIKQQLTKNGISSEFSPYMYTRLSDKQTVIKYPRALYDLYSKLKVLNYDFCMPVPPKLRVAKDRFGVALPASKQPYHMTPKQIEAHNNANKIHYTKDGYMVGGPIFDEDGEPIASNTKYIPTKQKLIKYYLNEYFKDVRQAKSKDAFVRRAVAAYKNAYRESSWKEAEVDKRLKLALEEFERNDDKFFVPESYQHPFPFPLWSRDGYRVFVTENGAYVPGAVKPENYIFVGKRGEKALKANLKFNFNDTGERFNRGQDHIGKIYPGLTKNTR